MVGVANATAGEQRQAVRRRRPQVVIAGGGVAALEALIALRDALDGFVGIDLLAPNTIFV